MFYRSSKNFNLKISKVYMNYSKDNNIKSQNLQNSEFSVSE